MRRLFSALILFAQFLNLLFGASVSVYAKGADYSVSYEATSTVFKFSDLGYTEKIMVGPYDSSRILFSLPSTWQLLEGGSITLRYTLAVSGLPSNSSSVVGGNLIVYFNNEIIDTILLDTPGENTITIPIPASALSSSAEDGRHLIGLYFDASFNCDGKVYSSNLVVSASSEVLFEYQLIAPATDLSIFPRPFYQPQALITTPTTIVIPDNPTPIELQSVLAVSAGLGSLTSGQLKVGVVTLGKLLEEIRSSNNLIFVGAPSKFPILSSISLPIPVTKDGFVITGANKDDGIIQVALSPWSQANLILVVSGDSEQAVLKAAQTVGAEKIVPTLRPDVAVIGSVNSQNTSVPSVESATLADLGYDNVTLGGYGGLYASYQFPVTSEQANSSGAYLDLVTSHSGLLDLTKTGISVFLNGDMLGSLQYDKDSEQIVTTRFKLLPQTLHRGVNRIEIVSDITPSNNCFSPALNSAWVTISSSSVINTPVTSREFNVGKYLDLKNFPALLLEESNLSDLAFILPKDDAAAWEQASDLAYFLGNKGTIVLPDMEVAYSDNVPDAVLNDKNLILFGRASEIPIINKLKDVLPAPFDANSDEAVQPAMHVNYRLLPGVSVGYIQLLPSPWNPQRTILAVMGNTSQGIPMAGKSLLDGNVSLKGNFAIVYGDQVLTTDTRFGNSSNELVGGLPVVTVTPSSNISALVPSPVEQPVAQGRAGWMLPVVISITVIILGFVVFIIRWEFTHRISSEKEKHPGNNKE
jgi:Bacterial cellulose synthase subunit